MPLRAYLKELAGHRLQGLDFTFHRAFDMVRSQRDGLEALIACGVPRVLTSGGAQTALQVRRCTLLLCVSEPLWPYELNVGVLKARSEQGSSRVRANPLVSDSEALSL